jgi:hypothetical protein
MRARPQADSDSDSSKKHEGAEGAMHEAREGPEEEETREGAADKPPFGRRKRGSKPPFEGPNRKRRVKGSENTSPAMKDAASGSCGCGKAGKCDGNCSGKAGAKRGDALTAPEYLAACDLGIQDRSRTYIRSRLDAAAARQDLKCGKGSISKGEKCTKGAATQVESNKRSGLTGKALLTAGLAVGGGYLALKHGRSVVNEVKAIGSGVNRLRENKAKLRAVQAQNKRMGLEAEGENSFTRFLDRSAPDKRRQALERALKKPDAKRKRRDSPYAPGFTPDMTELAI